MLHIILVVLVALACLVFSYSYLRAGAAEWPPAGVARPALLLPGLATLALAGCALAARWAERGARQDRPAQLKLGLAAALIGGAAALGLLALDWLGSGLSHGAHAYGSLVLALVGFQGTLVVIGLVLTAVVLAQALLGYFDARRFLAVQNTALYSATLLLTWLVIAATVYLSPYL
jgi:heme/copper-type cytochrome/quinol oxidase subunit 3